MIPASALAIPAELHARLHRHLFPGDGLEAAAILLCAKGPPPRVRLLAREALLVPHALCSRRERDSLVWPGIAIEEAIDRAEDDGLAIVLIHSHPGGLFAFSSADDESDRATMSALLHALSGVHGTAVMVPDGAVLARLYSSDIRATPLELVSMAGEDIKYWWGDAQFRSRPLAFTSEMTQELGRLAACVIGMSGTGSIVGEQVARLGFGMVVPIDFDRIEHRNLNRILNSTLASADSEQRKVDAYAEAVRSHRRSTVVLPVAASIATREAVLQASQCDVVFCCVDTLEARHIADLIAASFLIPLFDVGVSIPTRKARAGVAIADVCGRIDYVRPGGPTLEDRGVYDPAALRAEHLRRVAPDAHLDEVRAGYLKGLAEQAPAVISLNMRAASACVMEFLARAYPFRHDGNAGYARSEFSLAAGEEELRAESSFTMATNSALGRGAKEPLLGLPALRAPRQSSP